MNTVLIDVKEVAKTMVERYGFDPCHDNMMNERDNYTFSLLDALSALYDLESRVDTELEKINEKDT